MISAGDAKALGLEDGDIVEIALPRPAHRGAGHERARATPTTS